MLIRFDGVIDLVNDAALAILEKSREELLGASFARCFFGELDNDDFTQSVLDAVYQKHRRQDSYVPYRTGDKVKQLRIVSSFLREGENVIGVILVISDITELMELRDAIKAMETIRGLNRQLEIRNQLLKETFGRYLSDDIVREILDSPDGMKLGGQKRTLTIMMSDLRGFTMLCERMEPQALIDMLNHYFAEMYEEIGAYHGTLIELLGDGILAIFGAPIHSETHAADAVACAIAMQKRIKAVNEWNTAHGYEQLSMGIGVNTDEVILGNIGSERRTQYGVMGAAVNLAARIESYTTEGQILISQSTRALLGEMLTVDHEIRVAPKGVKGQITLSAVRGIGAPYDLKLEDELPPLRALQTPATVRFYVLDGKHVSLAPKEGTLLSVSEKQALVRTDEKVDVFDNLRMDIGGDLYAKTVHKQGNEILIRYTGKPLNFRLWMEQLDIRPEE